MSKYDHIETAADLVAEVAAHGLSMEQEDINRAQDIFGRSTIKELVDLANDIGRNNENGEPDPNGTWSSGRRGTQDKFYLIAFNIWNWRDAVRFYNEHTDGAQREVKRLTAENKDLASLLESTSRDRDACMSFAEQSAERAQIRAEEVNDLNAKLREKDTEIMALKAKLYDMMTAVA